MKLKIKETITNRTHNEMIRCRGYLTEDISSVQKRFPNIDEETFMTIIAIDPTYNPNRNSVGTYGKWLLNLYKKNKDNIDFDNKDFITSLLKSFDDNKKAFTNKDIGQFKSIDDLENALEEIPEIELSHRQKVRNNQKARKSSNLSNEAILEYSDDDWEIWIPKTYAASCKLGQGTNWCTATTESSDMYTYYTGNVVFENGSETPYYDLSDEELEELGIEVGQQVATGVSDLHIIINKHNKSEKYQMWISEDNPHEESQFLDANDNPFDLLEFGVKAYKCVSYLIEQYGIDDVFAYDLQIDVDVLYYLIDYIAPNIKGDTLVLSNIDLSDDIPMIPSRYLNFNNILILDDVTYLPTLPIPNTLKTITIPNSVEYIEEDTFDNCRTLTIKTPKDSYADEFAKEHNINVEYI